MITFHVTHPVSNFRACRKSFALRKMSASRSKVIHLYKELLHLGKEYPRGYDFFRSKLKAAFVKHRDITDPAEIDVLVARGQYIIKELEALYMLRKYRTLKRRYYSE